MTIRRYGDTAIRRTARLFFRRFAGSPFRRIALFGGTFNPIHNGHIKMAEAARKEYKLSVVYFIPCGIPPHKQKNKLLPAKLRYSLLKKAIKGKKYFKILDIEIKKKKPAYTIDTIREFTAKLSFRRFADPPSRRLADSPSRRLADSPSRRIVFFLIGQDSFESLHTWNRANELAKLVTFLVLPRGKRTGEPANRRYGEKKIKVPKVKNLKWHLVHTKPVNISAREIRKKISQNKPIQGLIPKSIEKVLKKVNLV